MSRAALDIALDAAERRAWLENDPTQRRNVENAREELQGLRDALAPALSTAYATRRELHDAAKALLDNYTAGVASGDWGNWDAEAEPEVIRLRAALAECNR